MFRRDIAVALGTDAQGAAALPESFAGVRNEEDDVGATDGVVEAVASATG